MTGLEWNVRISGARNRDVVDKVSATFDSYWESQDYRPYDRMEFAERVANPTDRGPTVILSPIEIRLMPFQERLLEDLAIQSIAWLPPQPPGGRHGNGEDGDGCC